MYLTSCLCVCDTLLSSENPREKVSPNSSITLPCSFQLVPLDLQNCQEVSFTLFNGLCNSFPAPAVFVPFKSPFFFSTVHSVSVCSSPLILAVSQMFLWLAVLTYICDSKVHRIQHCDRDCVGEPSTFHMLFHSVGYRGFLTFSTCLKRKRKLFFISWAQGCQIQMVEIVYSGYNKIIKFQCLTHKGLTLDKAKYFHYLGLCN